MLKPHLLLRLPDWASFGPKTKGATLEVVDVNLPFIFTVLQLYDLTTIVNPAESHLGARIDDLHDELWTGVSSAPRCIVLAVWKILTVCEAFLNVYVPGADVVQLTCGGEVNVIL